MECEIRLSPLCNSLQVLSLRWADCCDTDVNGNEWKISLLLYFFQVKSTVRCIVGWEEQVQQCHKSWKTKAGALTKSLITVCKRMQSLNDSIFLWQHTIKKSYKRPSSKPQKTEVSKDGQRCLGDIFNHFGVVSEHLSQTNSAIRRAQFSLYPFFFLSTLWEPQRKRRVTTHLCVLAESLKPAASTSKVNQTSHASTNIPQTHHAAQYARPAPRGSSEGPEICSICM